MRAALISVRLPWIAALALLAACSRESPGDADAGVEPPPAATASDARPPVAVATPDRQATNPVDAAAREHASPAAAAQAWFDRAREDAGQRHRQALQQCHAGAPAEFDDCEATADGALEEELRAARVEFDARMMREQ